MDWVVPHNKLITNFLQARIPYKMLSLEFCFLCKSIKKLVTISSCIPCSLLLCVKECSLSMKNIHSGVCKPLNWFIWIKLTVSKIVKTTGRWYGVELNFSLLFGIQWWKNLKKSMFYLKKSVFHLKKFVFSPRSLLTPLVVATDSSYWV